MDSVQKQWKPSLGQKEPPQGHSVTFWFWGKQYQESDMTSSCVFQHGSGKNSQIPPSNEFCLGELQALHFVRRLFHWDGALLRCPRYYQFQAMRLWKQIPLLFPTWLRMAKPCPFATYAKPRVFCSQVKSISPSSMNMKISSNFIPVHMITLHWGFLSCLSPPTKTPLRLKSRIIPIHQAISPFLCRSNQLFLWDLWLWSTHMDDIPSYVLRGLLISFRYIFVT